MRFEYQAYDGNLLSLVAVVFKYDKKQLPAFCSLVDTGATHTILPTERASHLGIELH